MGVTTNRRDMIERAALQAGALVDGAGVRAMAGVSEMPGTGAQMLRSLLGHELVASHALMMQLTAKTSRFLALIAAERTPEEQDRGCRQTVQLTAAIARLTDRYRLGLMGLARLEQQTAKEARRRAADLAAGDPDEGHPADDCPGGGSKDLAKLLAAMAAETRSAACELDKAKPNGSGSSGTAPAAASRGRLKHGNPSGDFAKAPRCGARTRASHACGQPAPWPTAAAACMAAAAPAPARPKVSPDAGPPGSSMAAGRPRSSTSSRPPPATAALSAPSRAPPTRCRRRNPSDPPHAKRGPTPTQGRAVVSHHQCRCTRGPWFRKAAGERRWPFVNIDLIDLPHAKRAPGDTPDGTGNRPLVWQDDRHLRWLGWNGSGDRHPIRCRRRPDLSL